MAKPYVAVGAVCVAGAIGAFGLVPFVGVGAHSRSVPTPLTQPSQGPASAPAAAPVPAPARSLHVALSLVEGVDASIPGSVTRAAADAAWDGDTLRVTVTNLDPARFTAGCPVSISVHGFRSRTVALTSAAVGTMAATQFATTREPSGKVSIDMTCQSAAGPKGGTVFADYEGSLG